MNPKKKNRIVKVSAAVFLLFAVVIAYGIGLPHYAALKVARMADIKWNVSPPQTISVYYPRWACGPNHPSWLLVEASPVASAPLSMGAPVRLSNDDNMDLGEHYFFECRGRFKSSLAQLIQEHASFRWGSGCAGDLVTGRFFAVEYCTPREPSAEQSLKIDVWLNPPG